MLIDPFSIPNPHLDELVQNAKTGDSDSLRRLFELEYQSAWQSVVAEKRFLGNPEIHVSSVIQGGFLSAYEHIEELSATTYGEFHAWIRKILRNELRRKHRDWVRSADSARKARKSQGLLTA